MLRLTISDSWRPNYVNEHVVRCNLQFHGRHQHDWVAVLDNSKAREGSGCRYKFYNVQMMFKYKHEDNVFSLAYLRFCQSLGQDEDTGMWIVQNTDKYEVLPISDIVRNVHPLIKSHRPPPKLAVTKTHDENENSRHLLIKITNYYKKALIL